MKLGFLILAHRYPKQLKNLIESLLLVNSSKIYIHIDLKALNNFNELIKFYSTNNRVVFIEKKYKVFWGSYSQILATYELIKTAVKNNSENYFMLLSGQDFLIKKPIDLMNFFEANITELFLLNFKLPNQSWKYNGLNRLGHYRILLENHPWLSNKLTNLISCIQSKLGFVRKVKFQQYGGSNWFNLPLDALKLIVNYVEKNPSYLKSFKHSLCADEIFIQSIILNSEFKNKVISEDLRYINWSDGPEYPKILRLEDYEKMINSENKFFGRKFDEAVDNEVILKLKNYCGS